MEKDKATRIVLDMKYARIIALLSEQQHISIEQAMEMFYTSPAFELIDNGVGDLHCRSDQYLADEIVLQRRMNCY